MNDMITMSVRLPKEVVTWLRKSAAMETIEHDKRVSMNSLIVEILAKAMEADRRILTRFAGSGKKIDGENDEN
jgi:predicted nuclease of predicted toxin-antitoxin system